MKNKSLFFVAAIHSKAQKSALQPHSLGSKTQHRSNAAGSHLSEPPSHGLHHSLNGVEAGRPGRDPAEAIRAMEAELEERRRIETMLKVGYKLQCCGIRITFRRFRMRLFTWMQIYYVRYIFLQFTQAGDSFFSRICFTVLIRFLVSVLRIREVYPGS